MLFRALFEKGKFLQWLLSLAFYMTPILSKKKLATTKLRWNDLWINYYLLHDLFKIIKAKRGKGLGILLAPYSTQFFRDLYFLAWCPLPIVLQAFLRPEAWKRKRYNYITNKFPWFSIQGLYGFHIGWILHASGVLNTFHPPTHNMFDHKILPGRKSFLGGVFSKIQLQNWTTSREFNGLQRSSSSLWCIWLFQRSIT